MRGGFFQKKNPPRSFFCLQFSKTLLLGNPRGINREISFSTPHPGRRLPHQLYVRILPYVRDIPWQRRIGQRNP